MVDKDDIIKMANDAGIKGPAPARAGFKMYASPQRLLSFAALVAAAEREKVARWMIEKGYATGHGDTIEDLLQELEWQIAEKQEPVAWADKVGAVIPHSHKLFQPDLLKDYTRPLYTAPKKTEQEQVECMCGICKLGKREWVGLTDDDIEKCTIAAERDYERYMHATRGQQLGQRDQLDWWIARAIEAKLKEKNT